MSNKPLHCYTLQSSTGLSLSVLNLGASIVELKVPTVNGLINVVLNYPKLEDYLSDRYYLGATVGRYANRISGAKYIYEQEQIILSANEGENQLHGGEEGFHRRYWTVIVKEKNRLVLILNSPDGDQGFPGNLTCQVVFSVEGNSVIIEYGAITDKVTPVNLTNHSYFNLDGRKTAINNHHFEIKSNKITPVNHDNIPTKEIRDIGGTAFDFQQRRSLMSKVNSANNSDINYDKFDHNYILNKAIDGKKVPSKYGPSVALAASAVSNVSGLKMNFYCSKPGMQFYTGDHLERPFIARQGFCFEPQYFPDSPNNPHFPNCFLAPEQRYSHRQIFEFIVK